MPSLLMSKGQGGAGAEEHAAAVLLVTDGGFLRHRCVIAAATETSPPRAYKHSITTGALSAAASA